MVEPMFVYLDESGDTGFKFDEGSTEHFVVTLLLIDDPVPLHSAVDRYRALLKYPADVEFKFCKSSDRVRIGFLEAIASYNFKVRTLVIDKRLISKPHMQKKETFYNYLVRLVLDYDFGTISNATLILDESIKSKRRKDDLRTYLRRMLNTDTECPKIRRIAYRRSHTDNLLQVTDMICGAINAAYEKGEGKYRQIIRKHIQDEWKWRPNN
jgi:hypothetical protein